MSRIVTISIEKAGGYNTINLSQWVNMPLNERIQLVTQKKVEFLDEAGDPIPVMEAMEIIKKDAEAVQEGIK